MACRNWIQEKILSLFVKTNGAISKPIFGGLGMIFMLHRVLPKSEIEKHPLNRGLAISPEKLNELLQFFTKKGFVFIQMNDLATFISDKRNSNKKFISLTFDDGYKDNLEYGLPILRKNKAPFTIYVTNSFPNHTAILWWYHLEKHLLHNSSLTLHNGIESKTFTWSSLVEASILFYEIGQFIKTISIENLKARLMEAFAITEKEIIDLCKKNALTWKEITELSKNSDITIGGHTLNHVSLKNQLTVISKIEIEYSKLELEEKIGKPVDHFAYPYGGTFDVSNENVDQVRKAGYKTAVLNDPGNFQAISKNQMHKIQRHYLSEDIRFEKLDQNISGITHFANNGFSKSPKL